MEENDNIELDLRDIMEYWCESRHLTLRLAEAVYKRTNKLKRLDNIKTKLNDSTCSKEKVLKILQDQPLNGTTNPNGLDKTFQNFFLLFHISKQNQIKEKKCSVIPDL